MEPVNRLRLNPQVTTFRENGSVYLFDPATRTCASMNEAMMTFIAQPDKASLLAGMPDKARKELMRVTDSLRERGILMDPIEAGEGAERRQPEDSASLTRLVIFVTTKCNLRCSYCYAHGGDSAKTISGEIWRLAMDHFFTSLHPSPVRGAASRKTVNLTLHGGGEPTVEFSILKEIVAEFRARAHAMGLQPSIAMGSNGTYGSAVHNWILENDVNVSISLDGPRAIHNRQRPLRSGGPSYDVVAHNLEGLVKAGRSVAIRATITNEALDAMEETVELARQIGLAAVHFEPVTLTGRCATSEVSRPDVEQFTEKFLQCFLLGLRYNMNVKYSGMHCFGRCRQRFCSACGQNFCVTPDGDVTTCYEVMDSADPAANIFFIGKVDVAGRRVILDQSRIDELKNRVAGNMEACKVCFLRNQCAGDCPVKSFRYSSRDLYSPDPFRCQIATRINRRLIVWLADGVIESRNLEDSTVISLN
jgi:uncharacterized protein